MMNDPTVLEASLALADRLLKENISRKKNQTGVQEKNAHPEQKKPIC
jgi:hypothetical protein